MDIELAIDGLFAVLLIVGVAGAVYRSRMKSDSNARRRPVRRNLAGQPSAVLSALETHPLAFAGEGIYTSGTVQLAGGSYKLTYHFPPDAVTVIHLVDRDSGDDDMLLAKAGDGVSGFELEAGGRFLFKVDPPDDDSPWRFEIQHLGLPSRKINRTTEGTDDMEFF